MNLNSEFATIWQFEVSKTKLSSKFMAGRGQVLLQALNWPLQAQEFAKRKKLQEILSRGMLKVDQGNTLHSFIAQSPNQCGQEVKSPCGNSSIYVSEPLKSEHREQNDSSVLISPAETWNYKEEKNQFCDAEMAEHFPTSKHPSRENSHSEWSNSQSNFMLKDFERKNAAKPLRKPDKSKKKTEAVENTAAVAVNSTNNYQDQRIPNQITTAGNVWLDWENNVIIQGSVSDEDLPDIATVEDNDDINDVVVDQYINALQNHHDITSMNENSKLTPQRVQQFSKLKSTTNADCARVLPGTQPNPPKGDDRWGTSELNSNVGWGDVGNANKNRYDDGSSLWSTGGSHYGGVSWSNAC